MRRKTSKDLGMRLDLVVSGRMSCSGLLRCYNKSCGKQYKEEANSEDSCVHHPGVPVFHDALKGWSCCKRRVTDFTEFLNIVGCTKSCHNNVKPPEPDAPKTDDKPLGLKEEIKVEVRKPKPKVSPERPSDDLPMKRLTESVSSSLKTALAKWKESEGEALKNGGCEDADRDEVKPGTSCKNNGCTTSYKNEASNDDKCWYHNGVPVFHEGYKFWTCCQKRTSDFNEFLTQEGCMAGSHRWVLTDEEKQKRVLCRYDWYQMGNHIIIPVFAKLSNPEESYVEANKTKLHAHIVFGDSNIFELDLNLHGVIVPEKSSVSFSQPKVEIKLLKEDISGWRSLELKQQKKEEKSS